MIINLYFPKLAVSNNTNSFFPISCVTIWEVNPKSTLATEWAILLDRGGYTVHPVSVPISTIEWNAWYFNILYSVIIETVKNIIRPESLARKENILVYDL